MPSLRLFYLLAIQRITDFATWRVWNPVIAGGDPATVLDDRLKELNRVIDDKRRKAQQKWSEFDDLRKELAKEDVDITDDSSDAFTKAEDAHKEYATIADELVALEARRESLWAMTAERGKTDPGSDDRAARERIKDGLSSRESHGARIVAGELYKKALEGGVFHRSLKSKIGDVHLGEMMDRGEFHALITGASDTSAGAFVEPTRIGYYQRPDRPLRLLDLIFIGETDSDSIEFVRETAFTNAAAETAEATADTGTSGTKPQSNITYEKDSEPVRTVAHWVATTRRALADAARLRSMIDGRLSMGLLQRLETQLVSGDGVGENLLGLLNQPGMLSQSRGADTLIDAIHKAITKVRLAFHEPNAVGINPLDWEAIRLAKNSNGDYLYGPPALAGQMTAWGIGVVAGAQFPAANPLVGDFAQAEFYVREGVQVLASDSHADFFIRNLIALLAEMRGALVLPLPEAFCEVVA